MSGRTAGRGAGAEKTASGRKKSSAGTMSSPARKAGRPAAKKPGRGPTVESYLAGLPPERRAALEELRKLILKRLPLGYAESMGFGMICYGVPLETYPDTYNGQPLCYLALASQKNHLALYAMSLYGDRAKERKFREEFERAGKKLDMGKSCIRFRELAELPLPVIGRMVAGTSVKEFVAAYERSRKKS